MRKDLKPLVHFDDFLKLDIRVGVIIEAAVFEKARKPAYRLKVHFGEMIGVKNSSAQICGHYRPEDLIGKQVLGVVNFPVKQIGNFFSEVLILGTYSEGGVILITPDLPAKPGDVLG
ncbi:MAG: tRNA-binding protein [Tissierellia bacterium]|nr:tRNA-binding protein [Bacillota bacterium]NLL22741.1 tRNA-binding protein [Tissierellia bacterium]